MTAIIKKDDESDKGPSLIGAIVKLIGGALMTGVGLLLIYDVLVK